MATAIWSANGPHSRQGSDVKRQVAKENVRVGSGRWVSKNGAVQNAIFKGYSYSFEHISEGIKRIAVTFLNKVTQTFLGDTIYKEKTFQKQFVVTFLQFRHVVIKYGQSVDYASGASEITEIAYRFALTMTDKIHNDCHSRISIEIPYIIDELIRCAKAEGNISYNLFNDKQLDYLVCTRNELRRRVNNYEEELDPTRLLGSFFKSKDKTIDPKRQVIIGNIIDYLTSPAFLFFLRREEDLLGTSEFCVAAIADAMTRRSGFKRTLGRDSSEIKEVEHSDIVSQAIKILAPHVLELPQDTQTAMRSIVEKIVKDLPADREAELRRLLENGSLTRETLPLLSLKTRAAALKIHYVTCEPWDPRRAEERKASRSLKERKTATFEAWLDRNLPDRRELELVASDLGFVDADAYRKIRNWKTEKVIESVEVFGLKEGSRPVPSQEQLRSLVAVRDDARWLLRTLDRARHG